MAQLGIYYFNGTSFTTATSVFTDADLTTLAADGYYSNAGIVRQQLTGVLLNARDCDSCAAPCGEGIATSISNQSGVFNASVDVANDIGAVIIYGHWGGTIPDGVDITYSGTHYNRWTAKDNHNGVTLIDGSGTTVDYSGIGNQGTNSPTYLGNENANLLLDSPYNGVGVTCPTVGGQAENYVYNQGSNSYVAQGTFQNVTITSSQIGYATDASTPSSPAFTAVIPKTGLTPTTITVDVYAPMCSTAFNWDLACPVSLTSWIASNAQSNANCAAATATYYFAPNATFSGGTFTPDTNTIPDIGNFVFTTDDGSTYLNDTSTIQYYIINNLAIGVRNGVVISKDTCITP